ncbi:hypothetical protein ACFYNV_29235 [Streptomyces albidoflavus]
MSEQTLPAALLVAVGVALVVLLVARLGGPGTEAAGPVPDLDGEYDAVDFDHCPAECRTTPHFLHATGGRTCVSCKTTTSGDQ